LEAEYSADNELKLPITALPPANFYLPMQKLPTNIALTFKYCTLNNHSSTATQLTAENT